MMTNNCSLNYLLLNGTVQVLVV